MNISVQTKIVITIILLVLFYAAFAIFSDIDKIKENYQQIRLIYLIPISGILIFSVFIRSLLQRFLLKKIGIDLSLKQSFIIFCTGLSMLITPGGSGQMIKSHFIQRKYGHPISKSLPLVFAERFFDFAAVSTIVFITVLLFRSLESSIILIVSTILLGGIIGVIKNRKFLETTRSIIGKIPFFKNFLNQTSQFHISLVNLFENKVAVIGYLVTLFAFFLEGYVIYLGFLSFDIDLGFVKSIQIYYTSVLFGTLSFLPGGTGVLEGVFVKLMIKQNLEFSLITSLIIFIRLTTTWSLTIVGSMVSYLVTKKTAFDNQH